MVWALLSQAGQSLPSTPDPWATVVGYGVASPIIALLVWLWRRSVAERDEAVRLLAEERKALDARVATERALADDRVREERSRADAFVERLLAQQEESLPVMRDMVAWLHRADRAP